MKSWAHCFLSAVLKFSCALVVLTFFKPVWDHAQAQAPANALNGDILAAKALLEEIVSRRLSRDLSSLLQASDFQVSTQLDIQAIPQKKEEPQGAAVNPEPISDLLLGSLDPEKLMTKQVSEVEKNKIQSFLATYRLRSVQVNVGLKKEVEEEVRNQVTSWLVNRIKSEFGDKGKSSVSVLNVSPTPAPPEKTPELPVPEKPKSMLDHLKDFQELAGQLALGLALLLAALVWALLSKAGAMESQMTIQNQMQGGDKEAQARRAAEEATRLLREKKESLAEEIRALTLKLKTIVPNISGQLETIIRTWSQLGEPGCIRIATFAEAVGQALGRLPIPVDAIPQVTKVFLKMSEQSQEEKKEVLTKIYWDILSMMNLGPDSLAQPFGYLGSAKTDVVSEVLLDENPRLRSIVSTFMPPDQRKSYLQSLPAEEKLQLLQGAADLKVVPVTEIKQMDLGLRQKMKADGGGESLNLDSSLRKLVEAMSVTDSTALLAHITGPGIQAFKRSTPSIAFLNEWSQDKLSILISRLSNDEVVTILRVRPDFTDTLLPLCPPMTAKVATDELARPDRLTDYEKNIWLESALRKMDEMISLKEASLEEMFPLIAPVKGDYDRQAG